MKKLKYYIEYIFYRFGIFLFSLFPLKFSLWLGKKLGRLAYLLDASHRRIALGNLMRAFPERDGSEIKKIAKKAFEGLGMNFVEFIRLQELAQRAVKFEGIENYLNAKNLGKGVFFLSAHFGNWELEAAAHALRFGRVHIIAKDIKNPYVDSHIKAMRNSCCLEIVRPRKSIYRILRILRAKGEIAMLLDQDTSHREGVFVDFFGQEASTQSALAIIAAKTGVPVVPAFIFRGPDGIHTLRYLKPLILDNRGDRKSMIKDHTRLFTSVIESQVRERPDQWFWVHRRWKTRPLTPQ